MIRAELPIPEELSILCGLAIGYPDPDFAANKLHVGPRAHREERDVPRRPSPGENSDRQPVQGKFARHISSSQVAPDGGGLEFPASMKHGGGRPVLLLVGK
jgi:hypothetical protein